MHNSRNGTGSFERVWLIPPGMLPKRFRKAQHNPHNRGHDLCVLSILSFYSFELYDDLKILLNAK